jgi:hypothetical protein
VETLHHKDVVKEEDILEAVAEELELKTIIREISRPLGHTWIYHRERTLSLERLPSIWAK